MARKQEIEEKRLGRLQRVADAIKTLFSRGRHEAAAVTAESRSSAPARQPQPRVSPSASHPRRVEPDIPLDVIDRAYTPPATSSKASFRSDGADHERDQDFAMGVADDRWNDEDRITNKSGDPRIGTHRRAYEPGEERPESRE
jgi:hypothetical protein